MADAVAATDTNSTTSPAAPVALFKKRGAKGKANLRKRPATPPPNQSDSVSSDYSSSEDESGRRIKRRKKTSAVVTASSARVTKSDADLSTTVFETDRAAAQDLDAAKRDATKSTNWFDEDKLSAKDLLGKTRAMPAGEGREGVYKGLANQTKFIQRNPDAPPARNIGPVKASGNVRMVTFVDMAPDVCKDYRLTGFW